MLLILAMTALVTADTADNWVEIEMVFVNGGKFRMGCPNLDGTGCLSDERPRHEVKLRGYYIGKYQVTQGQWKAVMGANPAFFTGGDDRPVDQVSWNDAQEFIKKLNEMTGKKYRLPTEAEWEYAALGGEDDKGEPFGGHEFLADIAWYSYNSRGQTNPAGTRGANELGLHDMLGNVWEWVSDWYDKRYYINSPLRNPAGPRHGDERVYRGCSFNSAENHCRISIRNYAKPEYSVLNLGFRLAHSP